MSDVAATSVRPAGFVRALAERQLRDARRREPGTFFAEDASLTLAEAYAVQDEIARLRIAAGDAVAGYKLGCIGPRIREIFGMSGPIRALLYRSELRVSGTEISMADHASLAVEGEVALRIGADGRIEAAFAVIELHDYVFRGARRTLAELVANNGLNTGVVLPADPGASSRVPDEGEIVVEVGGETIDRGPLWAMPGGALAARRWLERHLDEHGMALRPGDLILAGTPLGIHLVRAGDHVRVTGTGFAPVEIDVTA